MRRCYYCRRVIWPWQAKGWGNRFPRRLGKDWWHTRCRREFERSKGAP